MSGSAQTLFLPALKSILFATDFSPFSEAALPFLRAIALRHGSTVHVVHAIAPEARSAVPMDRVPELDVDQSEAEAAMNALLAGDAFQGIPHTSTVEHGHVWKVVTGVIEEKSVELIVLGTHGRRGLKKLVLGSTAEQIYRHAPCPVVTVGPHISSSEPLAQSSTAPILFATDFSSGSQHALPYALSLARASHAPLILLHAVPLLVEPLPGNMEAMPMDMEISEELTSTALELAQRQMAALLPAETMRELKPEVIVECGDAVAMILALAESRKAGFIVMGAHRASEHSLTAHLPWATASTIVREAPCPVLTVRS